MDVGYFHLQVIMSSTVTDIHVQVFVWKTVFNSLGYIPRREFLLSPVVLMFTVSYSEVPYKRVPVFISNVLHTLKYTRKTDLLLSVFFNKQNKKIYTHKNTRNGDRYVNYLDYGNGIKDVCIYPKSLRYIH